MGKQVHQGRRLRNSARRPSLEAFEPRLLLAIFTVNSTGDAVDPDPGITTLREAITLSNSTPLGGDPSHLIDFAITPLGGLKTIAPASALPAITRAVRIDGYTQAGAAPNTLATGSDAVFTVEINGTGAGAGVDGLVVAASDVTIRGLVIRSFAGNGIAIAGGSGGADAQIAGNFIGTNAAGAVALGNGGAGVLIDGATGVTVGGATPADRNLISGNTAEGVRLAGGASGNLVANSYLGTDAAGTAALANGTDGLAILASAGNTVGGADVGLRNVLSGNRSDGLELRDGASGNVVLGNQLGTTADGLTALGNGANGLRINNAAANTVGGPIGGSTNLISGNTTDGVLIQDGSSGNLIAGNFIGLAPAGDSAIPNGDDGVNLASGAIANTIGGAGLAANLISGNTSNGVVVSASSGNLVTGNAIGTDFLGAAAIANGRDGVILSLGATGNSIGGDEPNLISGNGQNGLRLTGAGTSGNVVSGNLIGTNGAGDAAIPNGALPAVDSGPINPLVGNGVLIQNGASANTVGGANVISGNRFTGVAVTGSGTSANRIVGNLIGTDFTGTAGLPNGTIPLPMGVTDPAETNGVGVHVRDGATDTTIGGIDLTPDLLDVGNVISANLVFDVRVDGPAATGTLIAGNLLGTDVNGTAPLARGFGGVLVEQADDTSIGGIEAGAGNVISGYGFNGVAVNGAAGAPVTGILIAGNLVGTDVTGSVVFGNGNNGVALTGVLGATIGGLTTAARNVISASAEAGILLSGARETLVVGNFIGTDLGGALGLGNGFAGIALEDESRDNSIGGATAAARNVFGNNGNSGLVGPGPGIYVAGPGATGNLIAGNFIGTNAAGTAALGNFLAGVLLDLGTTANTVGGTSAGSANVISGNSGELDPLFGDGVIIRRSSGNLVAGNFIGTDLGGTLDLGNNGNGVLLFQSAFANTVSGNAIRANDRSGVAVGNALVPDDDSSGNLISGNAIDANAAAGVAFDFGVSANTVSGANQITRNAVGVSINGATATGHLVTGNTIAQGAGDGVVVVGSAANTVSGNTLGGNGGNGVSLLAGATGNRVAENRIGYTGTGSTGTALPNAGSGVLLADAPANVVEANGIGGNSGFGVALAGASSGNLVNGNTIGLNLFNGQPAGNSLAGIVILNAESNAVAGNEVVFSGSDGIQLLGGSLNRFEGNRIGTSAAAATGPNAGNGILIQGLALSNTLSGNSILANARNGIEVQGRAEFNQINGNFLGHDPATPGVGGNAGSGLLLVGEVVNNFVVGNVLSRNAGFGFASAGGAFSTSLTDNFIGTDPAATATLGNGLDGVLLLDSTLNRLQGNVIAGNRGYGVQVRGVSTGTLVEGNAVGTDPTGGRPLPNGAGGILVHGGRFNALRSNVVSSNLGNGIHLSGGSINNEVSGNRLGTNAAGTAANGNFGSGLLIEGAPSADPGPAPPGTTVILNTISGNVVSGNRGFGIGLLFGASGNEVSGNFIGTDATGMLAIGNQLDGVLLLQSANNSLAGNVVAGNGVAVPADGSGIPSAAQANVRIAGTSSTGNLLTGNTVGTDPAGSRSLDPNVGSIRYNPGGRSANGPFGPLDRVAQDLRLDGVAITDGASANTVGGLATTDRNLVSGNRLGVFIHDRAARNLVIGNDLGTTAAGGLMADSQQQQQGVVILNSADNSVGGAAAGARNVISGQIETGVRITQLDVLNAAGGVVEGRSPTTGNQLAGNFIGTDPTGTLPVPNNVGVYLFGGSANTIGLGSYTQADAGGNLISGNRSAGIQVNNPNTVNAITVNGQMVPNPAYVGNVSSGNVIQGNRVGTGADGLARLTGNSLVGNGTGVFINDSPSNVVRDNLISGNNMVGLTVFAPEAVDNLLENNLIGPNVLGQTGPNIGNGFGFVDVRGRSQAGAGLLYNQVIDGANPSRGNAVRGNIGQQTVRRMVRSGPNAQSVTPVVNGSTGLIDSIEVVFNGYLERTPVTLDAANYRVELAGGVVVPLAAPPTYDEVGRRITLRLATGLGASQRYTLTVVGRPPGGLRSRPGLGVPTASVAFAGFGAPGTNAVFTFVGTVQQPTGASTLRAARRV